jgi:hypothetical protein
MLFVQLECLVLAMVRRRGLQLQRKVLEACVVAMQDLRRRRAKAINTFQAEQVGEKRHTCIISHHPHASTQDPHN